MKKRLFACMLCLLMLLASLPALTAAESAPIDTIGEAQRLADGILAHQLKAAEAASVQDWISGGLAQSAGISAEWYVIALSQSGAYDFSAYRSALNAYLQANTVRSASTRQKYALALLAAGGAGDPFIAQVMEDSIGQQGVMSWVYGLHLMNNGCESSAATVESACEALLALQLPDGGWAISGTVSDVDVTAMVIQALAPAYGSDAAVTAAVDQALALLSQRQLEDGDFTSYGVACPESAAQVWIALSALGVDGLTDARFIKNGRTLLDGVTKYLLPDGQLSHTLGGAANVTATVQTYFALTAYQRMQAGKPNIYLLDPPRPLAADASVPAAPMGYKPIAALVILGLAAAACVLLLAMKKRSRKNFIAVALIAAGLIGFVFATDFQSADSYYSGNPTVKTEPIGTVTLSIRCDAVAGPTDDEHIPQDGVILDAATFAIAQGDTVFDILTEAARTHGIHVESSGAQGLIYVSGIHYLYEFAFGDLSGWVYLVDGQSPSVGCDQYQLSDGESIEWLYTLDLGNDLYTSRKEQ